VNDIKPDTIECLDSAHGRAWSFYNGDSIEVMRQMPERCVDFILYSPPFSNLYTYSQSQRDMGNCVDDEEFFRHYGYLVDELYRMLRPGRLCAVHCKELVDYRVSAGRAGLRDFPGELIRAHERAGFKLHSRITIWKCPVTEMQRTKAHGLLYRTLRTDASHTRAGLPEYLLVFRRWPETDDDADYAVVEHTIGTSEEIPLDTWQKWASPVWMDINQTDVLNVEQAREDEDEKHMCPLQLDLIERAIKLWSNPGDVVLSPFGGIASEGYGALKAGRRFVGCELKPAYWKVGCRNLEEVEGVKQTSLFGFGA